jgi:hypothetical protein
MTCLLWVARFGPARFGPARIGLAHIGLAHYELTHWLYNPMMHIMRVQRRYKKP